jgi:hypothetical protein
MILASASRLGAGLMNQLKEAALSESLLADVAPEPRGSPILLKYSMREDGPLLSWSV